MLRRLREIAPVTLAAVAVLFWGLVGAVPAAHGAMPSPAPRTAQADAHHHDHAASSVGAVDATADQTDDHAGTPQDRCCPPGCSFAAMTPAPFGAVVHAPVAAPVFVPDTVAPQAGAAPPLRPPRLS